MKKRDNGKSPTDLLVCFPTRAHLTLMPKPICSPARTSSLDHHHNNNNKQIKKFLTRNKSNNNGGFKSSPVLWARTKSNLLGSEIVSEPSSPKVTCSGQIKIRPKTCSSSKNWQSVMEEIQRVHTHNLKKQRKKTSWVEIFTCFSTFRFDFRCFRSFPSADLDDDDGGDYHDHDDRKNNEHGGGDKNDEDEDCDEDDPRTVFSKWYMVLQDHDTSSTCTTNHRDVDHFGYRFNTSETTDGTEEESKTWRICLPPPSALLLMRCRSAPAKSWLAEKEQEEEEHEEEEVKTENELLIMRYDTDFYKLSNDVAKETWVDGGGGGGGGDGCVGGRDFFARSLSWKR